MVNRDWRESLRGIQDKPLDLLSEVLTTKLWVALLRAPLERAAGLWALVGAGAEIKNAQHKAVWGNHEVIVNDLLEGGASVEAKDACGGTLFHLAAQGEKSIVDGAIPDCHGG